MALAGFFRSGTSHRVRIALGLKGLSYAYQAICLPRGEHLSDAYLQLNPQGLVPVLQVEGKALSQSPAILEWLEETFPDPPLLPAAADDRARVRAMAAMIGCDVHPINNLRVLNHLKSQFGANAEQLAAWARHWIGKGFDALETLLARDQGHCGFCFSERPTLADCYLIPQVFSARRFNLDLAPYPLICGIDENCGTLSAFLRARPSEQPDAVP